MTEFGLWVAATLGIVTLTLILAEKKGVEIAIGIYATLTVVANIIAAKVIAVGAVPAIGLIIAPAAVIVYASTFLVTDMLSELYGKQHAFKAVITGFFANIIAVFAIYVAIIWTPAPFVTQDFINAFNSVLGIAPRIVLASICGYVVSQTHDVWAFHFWKDKTNGRHLWLRNNASTMVSQLLDTIIFISIAFFGVFPLGTIATLMLGQYILKVIIAALDTPFMYVMTYVWRLLNPTR